MKATNTTLRNEPRTKTDAAGCLWFWLGSGPLVEHLGAQFVAIFPGSTMEVDAILEDVWVHEPRMAAEEYAHLGCKISVEWFRRE